MLGNSTAETAFDAMAVKSNKNGDFIAVGGRSLSFEGATNNGSPFIMLFKGSDMSIMWQKRIGTSHIDNTVNAIAFFSSASSVLAALGSKTGGPSGVGEPLTIVRLKD